MYSYEHQYSQNLNYAPQYNFRAEEANRNATVSGFKEIKCGLFVAFLIFFFCVVINIVALGNSGNFLALLTIPYTFFALMCTIVPGLAYLFYFMWKDERGLVRDGNVGFVDCLGTTITLGYLFFFVTALLFVLLTFFIIVLLFEHYRTLNSQSGSLKGLNFAVALFFSPAWFVGAVSLVSDWVFLKKLQERYEGLKGTVNMYPGAGAGVGGYY